MAKKSKAKAKAKGPASRASFGVWVDPNGLFAQVEIIEKFCGGDISKVYDRAYEKAMAIPETVLKSWFQDLHHDTGETARAYTPGKTKTYKGEFGTEYFRVFGYSKNKSPVPLFFEYGTPRIPAEFVIYYAARDFKDEINRDMREALRDELRKRGVDI